MFLPEFPDRDYRKEFNKKEIQKAQSGNFPGKNGELNPGRMIDAVTVRKTRP
jgi:hypothetical protein